MVAQTDIWNPTFELSAPRLFKPIMPLVKILMAQTPKQQWPGLTNYQSLFTSIAGDVYSDHGQKIHFVTQGDKPATFEDNYEPRIYLKGEVQTRENNWHDFFQVFIWSLFPKTKACLNKHHYHAACQRQQIQRKEANSDKHKQNLNRSPLENAITLFDECGAIIVSSDSALLEMIRNFEWKKLFIEHRQAVNKHLRCIVFGHAMYEKALTPYTGMTTPSLLFQIDETLLKADQKTLIDYLDEKTSKIFIENHAAITPKTLQPFPVLGMPDWTVLNSDPQYYDNSQYFRPPRK